MNIKLKDGSALVCPEGASALDAAKQISGKLGQGRVGGQDRWADGGFDNAPCGGQCAGNSNGGRQEGLRVLRHTASHVMAEAVKRLYPSAKLAIGRQ